MLISFFQAPFVGIQHTVNIPSAKILYHCELDSFGSPLEKHYLLFFRNYIVFRSGA